METITGAVTNVASVASRAIWGDGTNPDEKKDVNDTTATAGTGNETLGKEPVSGELGDVKSGEPYDKGNVQGKLPSFTLFCERERNGGRWRGIPTSLSDPEIWNLNT